MNRPFDFIDGKKLDINNQSHRDIVIKRNKELQKALDEGVFIFESNNVKIKVITRVTIDCLVCGSAIDEENVENFEDVCDGYYSKLPTVKCSCCKASYHYHERHENYHLKIPKQKK